MTVKTLTSYVYTTPEGEEFPLTFQPVESSIKVIKTDTGYTVKYLVHDESPSSPRENDNLGTMVSFHKRYNFGDEGHGFRSEDYEGWPELEKALGAYMVLPIYMLDHSGIAIRTTSFNDPWDSGQIGFIYITREKALKEYGKLGKKTRDTVRRVLEGEVETYNQFITGEVYGIVAEEFSEIRKSIDHDSCWGFFGEKWALEALDTDI